MIGRVGTACAAFDEACPGRPDYRALAEEDDTVDRGRAMERSYLGGAATVRRLGGAGEGERFRAADARGAVAWLARGTPVAYVHAIEFAAAGARRGFHVHAAHAETLYLFSGALDVILRRDGETMRLDLAAGDLLAMAPGVAHGLIAREPSFAIALGDGSDPVIDVTAVPDLDA